MTSLSELRRLATVASNEWQSTGKFTDRTADYFSACDPPTILALLDIAEAARAFMKHEVGWNDSGSAYYIYDGVSRAHVQALRDALEAVSE